MKKDLYFILGLVILGVIITLFYFWSMLYYTNFHLSCPLDDSFIFYQYAKNTQQGYFLQYNKGDVPSTGATSLLYIYF
jgi:hypothetical protein